MSDRLFETQVTANSLRGFTADEEFDIDLSVFSDEALDGAVKLLELAKNFPEDVDLIQVLALVRSFRDPEWVKRVFGEDNDR